MKTILASLLTLITGAAAFAQSAPIDYRFDEIRRKVVLTTPTLAATAVDTGQHAQSGDKVQTGWFSYALIASEQHRARFEVFSATHVTLAGETPGVILSLERGRIRAAFDKIVGSEPRVVKTPGALLAVRGTQFDVKVDASGNTSLDVWEGIVEVQSALSPEPVMVRAGEESSFGPRKAPVARPMPEDRRHDGPGVDKPKDGNHGPRDRDRDSARPGGDRRPDPSHGKKPPKPV